MRGSDIFQPLRNMIWLIEKCYNNYMNINEEDSKSQSVNDKKKEMIEFLRNNDLGDINVNLFDQHSLRSVEDILDLTKEDMRDEMKLNIGNRNRVLRASKKEEKRRKTINRLTTHKRKGWEALTKGFTACAGEDIITLKGKAKQHAMDHDGKTEREVNGKKTISRIPIDSWDFNWYVGRYYYGIYLDGWPRSDAASIKLEAAVKYAAKDFHHIRYFSPIEELSCIEGMKFIPNSQYVYKYIYDVECICVHLNIYEYG